VAKPETGYMSSISFHVKVLVLGYITHLYYFFIFQTCSQRNCDGH